jgi:hypothetical protein
MPNKMLLQSCGNDRALAGVTKARRRHMLALGIERMSELAVIECEGKIVHSEAAKFREAFTSQQDARIIVLIFPKSVESTALV